MACASTTTTNFNIPSLPFDRTIDNHWDSTVVNNWDTSAVIQIVDGPCGFGDCPFTLIRIKGTGLAWFHHVEHCFETNDPRCKEENYLVQLSNHQTKKIIEQCLDLNLFKFKNSYPDDIPSDTRLKGIMFTYWGSTKWIEILSNEPAELDSLWNNIHNFIWSEVSK